MIFYGSVLLWLWNVLTNDHCTTGLTVNSRSRADSQKTADHLRISSWTPINRNYLQSDFRPIQLLDNNEFKRMDILLSELVNAHHDRNRFEWTTISLASHVMYNRNFVLLGGSTRVVNTGHSVIPRDGGSIFLCEFTETVDGNNPLGFEPQSTSCQRINPADQSTHSFLGSSSSAMNLGTQTSLMAYCDPLWRATSELPVGRCFIHRLSNGTIHDAKEFADFCQSGLKAATPCMAGYSIAFGLSRQLTSNSNDLIQNVQFWVGQPLSIPYGRVQTITDPFGSPTVTTFNRPEGIPGTNIGSKLGSSIVSGYASAPFIPEVGYYADQPIAQLLGMHINRGDSGRLIGITDWFGGVKSSNVFSGFGKSLLRISMQQTLKEALLVGAPFHRANISGSGNANRGRVYLYCQDNGGGGQNIGMSSAQNYTGYLDGPADSQYFGYSLMRLGDLTGDGQVLFAVGAPALHNESGHGSVYIMHLNYDCTLDPEPIQIINGPNGSGQFGAVLPEEKFDSRFNQRSTFVIPNDVTSKTSLQVFGTRITLYADCKYYFPPWLAIRPIKSGDHIPVHVTVHFTNGITSSHIFQDAILQIIKDQNSKSLWHQIDSDWNITDIIKKRFKLSGDIQSTTDSVQQKLYISFSLAATRDVRVMRDIESLETGLFIAYRFLQACFGGQKTLDEYGTCPNGSGLRRPIINWSGCLSRVPLKRFICYPHPACKSDVRIEVAQNKDAGYSNIRKIDLIHGHLEHSQPSLYIELYNHGPTYADGVQIELQFYGNLRFVGIKAYATNEDYESKLETKLNLNVAENETWVSVDVGSMVAPVDIDSNQTDPSWYFELSTYYSNYSASGVNYSLGAGVVLTVISGTMDPDLSQNSVNVTYGVINKPRIRISHSSIAVSSRMDNRTKPLPSGVGFQHRVDVNSLGPQVEHSMQVEYLGPSKQLTNVTLNLYIPNRLAPKDDTLDREDYIVYMFREIRARNSESSSLIWVDVRPRVTFSEGQNHPRIGYCSVRNSEKMINPLHMVGMDIRKTYSRQRRHTQQLREEEFSSNDQNLTDVRNPNEADSVMNAASGKLSSGSLFQRIPVEILQCGRVSYRFQQPVCAHIVCHLDVLQKNRPVQISVTGWLWARTLFNKHISDIDLVSTLSVDQGDIPPGVIPAKEPVGYFHLTQTFFFPQIRPQLMHQIPNWPIIVGVVLGILFLALIIAILYLLGFFKRKKPGLRKARYSKGGADELERSLRDEPMKRTKHAGFATTTVTDSPDGGGNRKWKGKKHRGELTILHPADLSKTKDTQDEEYLLQEPTPSTSGAQEAEQAI